MQGRSLSAAMRAFCSRNFASFFASDEERTLQAREGVLSPETQQTIMLGFAKPLASLHLPLTAQPNLPSVIIC
jgi:hypothetical protein